MSEAVSEIIPDLVGSKVEKIPSDDWKLSLDLANSRLNCVNDKFCNGGVEWVMSANEFIAHSFKETQGDTGNLTVTLNDKWEIAPTLTWAGRKELEWLIASSGSLWWNPWDSWIDNGNIEDSNWSESKEDTDISNMPMNDLLQKEKAEPWFLLKQFCEHQPDWTYKVDFKWNYEAEKKIWLSDMLWSEIKSVEVNSDKWDFSKWVRQWFKWWFFDGHWYCEILTWYTFKVWEKFTQEELANLENGLNEELQKFLDKGKIKELYTKDWVEDPSLKWKLTDIAKKALEYGMDPNVVVWLWKSDWDVLSDDGDWFDSKLNMVTRRFQILQNDYKEIEWDDWKESDGSMKLWLFIALLQEAGIIDEWKVKEAVKTYWELIWKEFSDEHIDDAMVEYKKSKIWNRSSVEAYSWEVVSWYDKIDPKNLDMWDVESLWLPDIDTLLSSPEWKAFARYKDTIMEVGDSLKVPANVMVQLFIKEWSHGNPYAKAPWSSATWLWQIINSTWKWVGKIAQKYWVEQEFDRYNVDHQIIATTLLLRDNYDWQAWNDWAKSVVAYHTWSLNFSNRTASQYASVNPWIARGIRWPVTANSYIESASRYYWIWS